MATPRCPTNAFGMDLLPLRVPTALYDAGRRPDCSSAGHRRRRMRIYPVCRAFEPRSHRPGRRAIHRPWLSALHWPRVEDVYVIGLFAGLGTSLGLALAGYLASSRAGAVAAALLAAAGAAGVALLLAGWPEAAAAAAGGLLGGVGAGPVVAGALGRGGTRGGTAMIVTLAALAGALLALIPLVGYLEALAVPLFGIRVRRRGGERYAGLRILARDER